MTQQCGEYDNVHSEFYAWWLQNVGIYPLDSEVSNVRCTLTFGVDLKLALPTGVVKCVCWSNLFLKNSS